MSSSKSLETISPGYLIASPRLDGSPFERAVVAMVHHGSEGAMGFIINKPLDINFGTLISSVNEKLASDIVDNSYKIPIHFGGPVQTEQLWLIYQCDLESMSLAENEKMLHLLCHPGEGTMTFSEGFFLAAGKSIIEAFATDGNLGSYRPFIGYCGWDSGQLETEIDEGSWLMMNFEKDFLFNNSSSYWNAALKHIGVDPMAFTMMGKQGMA